MMFSICDSQHVWTHPRGGWGWAELRQEGQPEAQAGSSAVVSVWICDASFRRYTRELGEESRGSCS